MVAPLNRKELIGVAWDGRGNLSEPPLPDTRLKPIVQTLPAPPMTASLRRFIDWVASYTLSPPGAVLRMAMSAPAALEPPPVMPGWMLAPPGGNSQPRLTPERKRVLAAMAPGEVYAGARLAEAAGVSPGVLRGMADNGLLRPAVLPRAARFARPDPDHPGPRLSEPRPRPPPRCARKVAARAFGVTLLAGVTGSGKTEVYLDAVAECLRQGRQALVMLPEIALSAQWLDRFRARFGVAPALWHSEVGSRTRRDTWRAVAEGEAPVVVGARSALFLPFPDLGLVVVDEEHETAFKQEDGVVYHARDMAVVRARLAGAACVLVSATPSLETLTNVESGRYAALRLPQRHGGAGLPSVETDRPAGHAAGARALPGPPLIEAIGETLARGEQAMLFLNRRGYAPLTLCRHCGHRMRCPNCTAWLVEHRAQRRLQCHHCGHAEPPPAECPECGTPNCLTPVGPGVERITEEAAALLPEARRLVMASRHHARPGGGGGGGARHRGARGGPHHRHPDRRQGLALPAPDPGRRGGRRSRPRRRRPARGGAHGPAPAPGGGPRRAGRGAGAGAAAKLQPRASGDAGAGLAATSTPSWRRRRARAAPAAGRPSAAWRR